MTFSICIATYGDGRWRKLAQERAYLSALAQDEVDEIVILHLDEGTVASARNEAAERAQSDWLVFLDADDELSPGFIVAMKDMLDTEDECDRLLLTPAVTYVIDTPKRKIEEPPKFWREIPFTAGNWLVIGTAIQRSFFHDLGGFADEPAFGAYEDYEFWLRADKAGARIQKVPDAIYRAWKEPDSRHRGVTAATRLGWHYEIGRRHYPAIYTERWLARHTRGRKRR